MTTIVCVRKNGKVAIGGDGQATLGNCVEKGSVRKVRRLYKLNLRWSWQKNGVQSAHYAN